MIARYKLFNNVIGWVIFLVASFVFLSTIEPTASFWDCGEYVACSYKLEVGHPPGAPFFLLVGRLFSLFVEPQHVAAAVNTMSGLASAGTILFMFWSLTLLGRKLIKAMNQEFTSVRMWAVLGSAAVGSLAYAFTDSFWFSAVEGEVYAMSSFFTALVFWAILRWDADDSPRADRWIVFIAYMIGLSVGVHLLNLLTIPSIVFIIYFKKFEPSPRGLFITAIIAVLMLGVVQNGIIPGIVSAAANYELFFVNSIGLPFNAGTIIYFLLLIGFIVAGIRYTIRGTKQLFNMFVGLGAAFFFFTLVGAYLYGKAALPFFTFVAAGVLVYYFRENRVLLNTILLSFTVLVIGYSSFFILVIRSNANTPMDENNPQDAISLLSYLNREQYGDWPLLYGQYYNAELDADNPADDGTPVYAPDTRTGQYEIVDPRKQSIYNFTPELCTVFPRMWEMNQRSHVSAYESWGDVAHNHVNVQIRDRNSRNGEMKTVQRPTMAANLRYFTHYQINWMYYRYFMWNFAGKQNDIQGHGNSIDGNWQSGLSKNKVEGIDVPKRMRDNPANNSFYFLPLILGIIGMIFHFSRDWKNALVVMLLFLFTGLAIVVYLNQYPYQPRERDYAYAGSFYAFAFWIGIGAYAIFNFLHDLVQRKDEQAAENSTGSLSHVSPVMGFMAGTVKLVGESSVRTAQYLALFFAMLLSAIVPWIMGAQGWDDHNRSNRFTCRDFAKNYLETCDRDAVLFTNGDNDTFPLWYAQEVEGYRTDVRVLNLSLLNTDWYIDQASRMAYDSPRVPFSLPKTRYRQGSCDQVFFDPDKKNAKAMSARELIDLVKNADPSVMQISSRPDDHEESYSDTVFVLPTNKVYIPVDKAKVKRNGTVPANTPDSLIADRVEWTINKSYLLKADLMVLDLLASNNWDRPIYFAVTAGSDSYLDLDNIRMPDGQTSSYLRLEGLAYRFVPMLGTKQTYSSESLVVCDTDIMYDKLMGKKGDPNMTGYFWGGLEQKDKYIYMDENNLRFTTNQRLQMLTLAKMLNDEGKKDKAKAVLDRCYESMPPEHVPYEPVMMYMVENYYRAGDKDKANMISKDLFTQCEDEYRFLSALSAKEHTEEYNMDMRRNASVMSELAKNANQYGQGDLVKDYDARLQAFGMPTTKDMMRQQMPDMNQQPTKEQLESLMKAMQQDCLKGPRASEK